MYALSYAIENGTVFTEDFDNCLCSVSQDAQEFLCQILDQLKEEIIALNKELKKISEAQEEQKVPPLSPQGSLANPTVENFECEVLHSISCLQ